MYNHYKEEAKTHGGSPGNGMTPTLFSEAPLATEGEATPGPDDYNPYDQVEYREERRIQARANRDPTEGSDDPFVFDDVEGAVDEVSLPGLESDMFDLPHQF